MRSTDKESQRSTGKKTKRGTKTSAIRVFTRHETLIIDLLREYRQLMEQNKFQNMDKDMLKQAIIMEVKKL